MEMQRCCDLWSSRTVVCPQDRHQVTTRQRVPNLGRGEKVQIDESVQHQAKMITWLFLVVFRTRYQIAWSQFDINHVLSPAPLSIVTALFLSTVPAAAKLCIYQPIVGAVFGCFRSMRSNETAGTILRGLPHLVSVKIDANVGVFATQVWASPTVFLACLS